MALRDSAIVAYAETKVMKKSDRDVWVLMGEILEQLLDKSGFEKSEVDGLVMSGLTGTGGRRRSTISPRSLVLPMTSATPVSSPRPERGVRTRGSSPRRSSARRSD